MSMVTVRHEKTPQSRLVSYTHKGRQLLRSLLIRDELVTVVALIVREHHCDPVVKGEIVPGNIVSFAALAGPGHTDAGPDFLASLVFAWALPR